jgi:hypothetical protein
LLPTSNTTQASATSIVGNWAKMSRIQSSDRHVEQVDIPAHAFFATGGAAVQRRVQG